MANYVNPYMQQNYQYGNSFYSQPSYQAPQQPYQQPYQQQPQVIDWDAVAKACQTLAVAAANVPGGGEYATKADLENLKKEILEGVKANAKSSG